MARTAKSTPPGPWHNAITHYGEEAPDQLLAFPGNPKIHPRGQQTALEGALSELGWLMPVVVSERSGHVLDGHARIALAISRNEPTVPVAYVDIPPEQEALAIATIDPIGSLAVHDREALDALLRDVSTGDAALQQFLTDFAAGQGLEYGGDGLAMGEVPEPQIDRAEELREQWGTAAGQLWVIPSKSVPGKMHRLLCGDSTKSEVVARLMDGGQAALLVTSPPYNQRLDQFHPSGMHKEADWVAKLARLAYPDSLPEDEYQRQQAAALRVWHASMVDGGSVFYNHKNRYREKEVISPLAWLPGPFRLRQEIIWKRPGSVTQNARMFLPCDERIYWLYKGDDFYFDDTTEHKTWSSIWEIAPQMGKDHPAAFPTELPERCMRAASRPGDLALEPYAGSGSSIVAAEQLGRLCYGCEIVPPFIAVCLQRLADMGLTPRLESQG